MSAMMKSPPSQGGLHEITAKAERSIAELGDMLYSIDSALMGAGETLERLQPYREGKLALLWPLDHGRRRPRLVRWKRLGRTKWEPVRIPLKHMTQRASFKGAFGEHYAEVVQALKDIKYLLTTRETLLNTLANLQRGTVTLRAAHSESIDGIWRRHRG